MSQPSPSVRSRRVALASLIGATLAISALAVTSNSLLARRALGADSQAKDAVLRAADKYSLRVPGGLAFSEFKGYEGWAVISVSHAGLFAAILGNPAMIEAYRSGIPGNGKPFPDGAKMAKIHWSTKQSATAPSPTTVPSVQHDVDFMVKDSKRFAASGGWGYAEFEYDPAAAAFRPGTSSDKPPQANDAKCGFGCHAVVKTRDYVFTEFAKR